MISRRHLLATSLGSAGATLLPQRSMGATFPDHPIRLVIPWTPGGAIDTLLRSLADASTKEFGQTVVPMNRAGGVGLIGQIGTANSAPDGYTITHWAINLLRSRYLLAQQVTWDPLADFTYIIGLANQVNGMVVLADSPYKTFADYIAAARKRPGALSYSSNGPGTTAHLAMESIAGKAQVQLLQVPYKGFAEAVQGLIGGFVDSLVDTPGWEPFVASGKLRLLVTFGDERTKKWPQVPTAKELGFGEEGVFNSPFGIAGPKGIDPVNVRILHDGLRKAAQRPEVLNTMAQFNYEPWYQSPEAFYAWAKQQDVREKALIQRLGLTRTL